MPFKKHSSLISVVFSVGFHPYKQSADIGKHGVLKFNHATTSVGGGYSAHTGNFTAPVAGTYAFYLSIRADSTQKEHVEVALLKNGHSLCMTVAQGSSTAQHGEGSCLITTHLKAGDTVQARHHAGSTRLEESFLTTLSGFLLFVD